jgi:hypothetical protein
MKTGDGSDRRGRGGPPAAQDGLDRRGQLARAERLQHVIIGADLQADDPVDLVGAGGEEDDRDIGKAAQGPAKFEAITVGQADVQYRQIEAPGAQPGKAVDGQRNVVANDALARRARATFSAMGRSSSTKRMEELT